MNKPKPLYMIGSFIICSCIIILSHAIIVKTYDFGFTVSIILLIIVVPIISKSLYVEKLNRNGVKHD